MHCKKSSLELPQHYHYRVRNPSIRSLISKDTGSISVMMVMMFPVLLGMMFYFENYMEAQYVSNETQAILDMSTKGAAATGDGIKVGSNIVCTIPYDEEDEENSGYHVAVKLLKKNIKALPVSAQAEILDKLDSDSISGLNTEDTDQWASGISKIDLTYSYTPTHAFFGKKFRIHSESVAKCTATKADKKDNSDIEGVMDYHLTQVLGTIQGPSGKETFYNMEMSGVIQIMRNAGYSEEEYPYTIREDGVKMLGPYVMIAANLNIRPRGSLVKTSLGTGIVCDTGSFVADNPTAIDIATNWGPQAN